MENTCCMDILSKRLMGGLGQIGDVRELSDFLSLTDTRQYGQIGFVKDRH